MGDPFTPYPFRVRREHQAFNLHQNLVFGNPAGESRPHLFAQCPEVGVYIGKQRAIADLTVAGNDELRPLWNRASSWTCSGNHAVSNLSTLDLNPASQTDAGITVVVEFTPVGAVEAATTAGVRIIGVATGKSTVDDLHEAGAPHVLHDLTNPTRTTELILDLRSAP